MSLNTLRKITGTALLFYGSFLCGCDTVRGTGHLQVDHGTPETVWQSMDAAISAKDYGAYLDCYAPRCQDMADPGLAAHKRCRESAVAAAQAIKERFGDREYIQFMRRNNVDRVLWGRSPLETLRDGNKISWDGAEVAVAGDRATCRKKGSSEILLEAGRYSGKWYVVPHDEAEFDIGCKTAQVWYADWRRALDDLANRVKRNEIRREELEEILK